MSSNPQKPSKLFYRIGEVSRLTGLEPYVLRYWETEFPQIKPDKGKSGQRLYKKEDVDNIFHIKQLLYKDGYTIAGARRKLNGKAGQDVNAVIESAKKDLREILDILK
ncbi:MAG TPA: MerR family transcriptional regulator [Nitrospirota bacterium]|nr:MerR family transcriptional regulator [Nitrospirota bacterium]